MASAANRRRMDVREALLYLFNKKTDLTAVANIFPVRCPRIGVPVDIPRDQKTIFSTIDGRP
jgi:hypothetical protein